MLTNLWTQREEVTACELNYSKSVASVSFVISFCVLSLRILNVYIYLFPVLHTRPSYRTILQTAYISMQCSTDSPVSVAFYRLAKHLYFWKVNSFPSLHVRPSCKTILQTAYTHVQCSTDSLAPVAPCRSGKCICKITHLYFPRIIPLKFEAAGNIIPKCIYC